MTRVNNVVPISKKQGDQALPHNMVDFVKAYIECILKHSSEGGKQTGAEDGEDTLEQHGYTEEDLETNFQLRIANDCTKFLVKAHEFIDLAVTAEEFEYDYHLAGGDFWLARNRYGDGFWCRDLDILGKKLTEVAEEFKRCTVFIGDNGKICCS